MPKTGQTRTVQRMQEEIAKAKAKRSKSVDNQVDNTSHIGHSPVSNESISKVSNEGLHRQPIGHSTVSQNTENTGIKEVIKEDISKDINVLRHDSRVELRAKGLTDAEIDENLGHLLDAYRTEGLTPDPDRLTSEILAMARMDG